MPTTTSDDKSTLCAFETLWMVSGKMTNEMRAQQKENVETRKHENLISNRLKMEYFVIWFWRAEENVLLVFISFCRSRFGLRAISCRADCILAAHNGIKLESFAMAKCVAHLLCARCRNRIGVHVYRSCQIRGTNGKKCTTWPIKWAPKCTKWRCNRNSSLNPCDWWRNKS